MKTLITNAFVLDMVGNTANIEKKDILINDNIIEKIDKCIDKDIKIDEKINAKNMLVMPGLINTHTHLRQFIQLKSNCNQKTFIGTLTYRV